MKGITAYIKPHRLTKVAMALQKVEGLRGLSVVEVKGFGRKVDQDTPYPASDDFLDFALYTKLEIFCPNHLLDEIVSIINKNAYTGLRGDGKIYVYDVLRAVKIGKGEIGG